MTRKKFFSRGETSKRVDRSLLKKNSYLQKIMEAAIQKYITPQILNVNPDGVMSNSNFSDTLLTVLIKRPPELASIKCKNNGCLKLN